MASFAEAVEHAEGMCQDLFTRLREADDELMYAIALHWHRVLENGQAIIKASGDDERVGRAALKAYMTAEYQTATPEICFIAAVALVGQLNKWFMDMEEKDVDRTNDNGHSRNPEV